MLILWNPGLSSNHNTVLHVVRFQVLTAVALRILLDATLCQWVDGWIPTLYIARSGIAPSNDTASRRYKEFPGIASKLDIDSGPHLPAWPKYRQVYLCARDTFVKKKSLKSQPRKTNTNFPYKTLYYLGVRGLTTSSYIVYNYTTSGPVEYMCTVCTVHMYWMYST